MPNVRYLGPHDEVTLPDHGVSVVRGDTVAVSDDLAAELVARENGTSWEPVADVVEDAAADDVEFVGVGPAPKSTKGRAAADKES